MCVFISLIMMMMIMSTFIAHDSINANAQCAERCVCICVCGGGGGAVRGEGGGGIESQKKFKKIKDTWCKVIHTTGACMCNISLHGNMWQINRPPSSTKPSSTEQRDL